MCALYHAESSVVTVQKQIILTCSSSGGTWNFFKIKVGSGSKKVENHWSRQ